MKIRAIIHPAEEGGYWGGACASRMYYGGSLDRGSDRKLKGCDRGLAGCC